jgi:hypothetical protein
MGPRACRPQVAGETRERNRRFKLGDLGRGKVSAPPGTPGYVPPSASTAKTLILISLILGLIGAVVLIAFGILYIVATAIYASPITGYGAIWLAFGLIGLIILYLVYTMCYKRVQQGQYEAARTPTLIFWILALVTLNIIIFILLLIAWIKLGDAVREAQTPPMAYGMAGQPMMGAPMAAAPMAAPAAAAAAAAPPGPAPVCPTCGKPATWIPQYSRYYCYTDSKYV